MLHACQLVQAARQQQSCSELGLACQQAAAAGSGAHMQDLSEEAQLLVQEQQARREGVHAAQHQRVVCIVPRAVPWRPAALQQLKCLVPAKQASSEQHTAGCATECAESDYLLLLLQLLHSIAQAGRSHELQLQRRIQLQCVSQVPCTDCARLR